MILNRAPQITGVEDEDFDTKRAALACTLACRRGQFTVSSRTNSVVDQQQQSESEWSKQKTGQAGKVFLADHISFDRSLIGQLH